MSSKIIMILTIVLLQAFTFGSQTSGYSSDHGILYKTTSVPNTTENAGDKTDLGNTLGMTSDELDGEIDPLKNVTFSPELYERIRGLHGSIAQIQMDLQFSLAVNIMIYVAVVPMGFLIGYIIYKIRISPANVTITQRNFIHSATKDDENMVPKIFNRTHQTTEKKYAYTFVLKNMDVLNQMEETEENNIDKKFDNIV